MLHHISFAVSNILKSSNFYDSCLEPLGYRRVFSSEKFIGYGIEDGNDMFAIAHRENSFQLPESGFHLAFLAPSKKSVDDFFESAISSGGKDNGPPGLRENYGKGYYAAFVYDPDGYHIEAVYKVEE